MIRKYEAPMAEMIEFHPTNIITTSQEEEHEILVVWGDLLEEYDSQRVSIFE